jgi:NAD(P)-dependent dehydrogenase (short-subunit alcohol dehydrogenase family)
MAGLLQDKVAIITGAAHGMGEAIAESYAAEGAALGLLDVQEEALSRVVERIAATGGRVVGRAADVRRAQEVGAAVEAVRKELGPIDLLVNAAGLGIYRTFDELTEEDWDTTFDVNVKGTFLVCKAVVPEMAARGSGTVINIASLAALIRGFNRASCYSASKYAVRGFSRALAVELNPQGVTVCCLSPGTTDSHFRGQPTGNPGWMKPEDVAAAALYIATQRPGIGVHELALSNLSEGW